ncbi:MAG: signal recognition particle protein [Fimbriimonadaceae bacterium]
MLDRLTRRLTGVFSGLRRQGRLSEDDVNTALREVRVALLEADVNYGVAKDFLAKVKEKAVGENLFGSLTADQTLLRIVRDEIVDLLGEDVSFHWAPNPPTVVLMAGLQGSGKTTTCAKLARWLLKEGKKPLMAACDLQRPAAVHQLQVLGEQVGAPVHTGQGTPVDVAQEAIQRARHLFCDVLIVDTAGRLAIDEALMDELHAIEKAVGSHERLLVLDATIGQESVNVAQAFQEKLGLTGVVVSKMDGDARGGAVLSVRSVTGVPVRFVGTGEGTEALERFSSERMAGRIIGMGDVLGIIEKAEEAAAEADTAALESKFKTGKLDFNDFLEQMRMVRKMGPLKKVMGMVPGLAGAIPEEAMDQIDDRKLDHLAAMVLSMTPEERANPDILNGSRRKRIARGSGRSPEEVNRLVEQLYQMRKTMKQMSLLGKRTKRFRRQ